MSLFICKQCQCVDNTSLNSNAPNIINNDYPNMSSMEMEGFRLNYFETNVREERILLCSECNSGTWHNEFKKELATEIEIIMGRQLEGDMENIFTFHSLWRKYNDDPDSVTIEMLNKLTSNKPHNRKDATNINIKETIKRVTHNMNWMYSACDQYIRETPKIGRNDLCPCGSKKKYKKCCI